MKIINENETRRLQLQMLDIIHKVCSENDIRYYLMYGSLLGAIRHNGFIPWDDDIDIIMFREDYYRLRNKFHMEGMSIIDCEIDENYYLPIPKVINTNTILKEDVDSKYKIGVYIDIFLLDTVETESLKYKMLVIRELIFRGLLASKILPQSDKRKGIKRLIHSVLNIVLKNVKMNTLSKIMNQIAKNSSKNNPMSNTLQIFTQTEAHNLKKTFERKWFLDRKKWKFENNEYYVPARYKEILECLYGDYMALPPKNERIRKHSNDAFWKYD